MVDCSSLVSQLDLTPHLGWLRGVLAKADAGYA